MWTILALLALLAVIVGLIIKTETLGKEYKRLQAQARIMDSDSQQVQQVTFELAETLALTLTSQLHAARRMSRFDEKEIDIFELCLQAIPLVCKEILNRQLSLAVAFQRSLRQLTDIEPESIEAVFTRHGRLVQAWQRNNLSGYLQLCQQMVLLVQEHSHKDMTRHHHEAKAL